MVRRSLSETGIALLSGKNGTVRVCSYHSGDNSSYKLWCCEFRRRVAASAAAALTGTPPERSAAAADASVYPVVTRSSTRTTRIA